MIIKIKALTHIWTGDANRECTVLRETGILGSLRWWYEAIVRGFGGYACDPTDTKCDGKNHCDVCELFGCTGWARKFRLEVEKNDSDITLEFIQLRKTESIEKALLNKTFQLIEDYGAIGGKLVSEKNGLLKITASSISRNSIVKDELNNYFKNRARGISSPSLLYFFFVKEGLERDVVSGLKSECSFLKGKKLMEDGRSISYSKTYFYKMKNVNGGWHPDRLLGYTKNSNNFTKVLEYCKSKGIAVIQGSDIIDGWLKEAGQ